MVKRARWPAPGRGGGTGCHSTHPVAGRRSQTRLADRSIRASSVRNALANGCHGTQLDKAQTFAPPHNCAPEACALRFSRNARQCSLLRSRSPRSSNVPVAADRRPGPHISSWCRVHRSGKPPPFATTNVWSVRAKRRGLPWPRSTRSSAWSGLTIPASPVGEPSPWCLGDQGLVLEGRVAPKYVPPGRAVGGVIARSHVRSSAAEPSTHDRRSLLEDAGDIDRGLDGDAADGNFTVPARLARRARLCRPVGSAQHRAGAAGGGERACPPPLTIPAATPTDVCQDYPKTGSSTRAVGDWRLTWR